MRSRPGPERRRPCTDHWLAGEVRTSVRGAGQIPLQVEQRYLILGFQRSASPRFHRRDAPARFPSRGSPAKEAALGLLRGYDNLERGRWNVA